jgi:hypothetical protein
MAQTFNRITQDPAVLAGRATIRGLRISVAHVVNLVANGMTTAQIVEDARLLAMRPRSLRTNFTLFAPDYCGFSLMRESHPRSSSSSTD